MGGSWDRNDQNLPDRLRALERKVDALTKGAPLRNASITEGGLRVGGQGWIKSTDWDGTGIEDPGTVGWALGGPDAAAIINTLFLRDGIIGNEALSNPVEYGSSGTSENSFGVTVAPATRAGATVKVPLGFTRATLLAIATAAATNSTAAVDYLYVRAAIGGVSGGGVGWRAAAGAYVAGMGTAIRTLQGLTGGEQIPVGAAVNSLSGAWSSATNNAANCDVIAFFAR